LIESNSTIPVKKSQVFSTAVDNQPAVEIHVLQGERPMASDNRTLGKFQLTNIPPAQRGIPQIEVAFDIDANGIINVSAMDKGTGKQQNIKIESGSKLTEEEIEKMRSEAQANESADKERLQKTQIMNDSDSLIFQVERSINDFGDKVSDDDRTPINDLISDLKKARESEDLDLIENKMKELSEAMGKLSASVYSAADQPQSEQPDAENTQGSEDLQEAEFEEVK
jgi:molecular chaperone DnaK